VVQVVKVGRNAGELISGPQKGGVENARVESTGVQNAGADKEWKAVRLK